MILLQPDCLVFRTAKGENIPCSAHEVTLEMVGEAAAQLNEEIIQHAAQAVLHYFKSELGKAVVSVGEFAQALERVLRGLGYDVKTPEGMAMEGSRVAQADLRRLAVECGKGFELVFFQLLRQELRAQLLRDPALMRFHGLRSCVMQLAGTRRWTPRCQHLRDQIVDFLRDCFTTEGRGRKCSLLVE